MGYLIIGSAIMLFGMIAGAGIAIMAFRERKV